MRSFFYAVLTAIALTACGSAPPKSRSIDARIVASADVNPDRSGVASPVTVRIIELRGDAKFKSAAFFALFDDVQAALGSDFVAFEDQVLRPGEQRPLSLNLRPETEFVGVVASFQDIAKATWRDVKPLPKKSILPGVGGGGMTILVGRNSISIGN